ncbi:MAG: starch-binding protein [Bacteroidales bacterium]|nr:starch-binding protein [Bacteroidales bacterium]
MKKIFSYLFLLAAFAFSLAGCKMEEITFDHEQPAFDIQQGMILIEAILPTATAADDEVYIAGPFAGDSLYVVGKSMYRLAHSSTVTEKWGIYLDPSSFKDGKTLADGFYFVNVQQGLERTVKNEDALHTLNASVGQRYNVYAERWRSYFAAPEIPEEIVLPELTGYGLFVDNSAAPAYAELALYAWGDAEAFGGWPGMRPTGTWDYKGVTYTYFDMGPDAVGLTLNLIINNNNGGSQLENFDCLKNQVIDHNFFFTITDDNIEPADVTIDNGPVYPEMAGFGLFVDPTDSPIYSAALALYAWGDAEAFGGWPGMQPTGTWEYKGVTYTYFDMGADATGLSLNLILNNNNGGSQLENFDCLKGQVIDHHFFFKVTDDDIVPLDLGGGSVTPPAPPAPTYDGPKIYVVNNTNWPGKLYAHYWGDGFGTDWPGTELTETETIDGVEYLVLPTLTKAAGQTVGIIFHSDENDEANRFQSEVTLDTDRLYVLDADALTEVDGGVRIIVKDATGWPGTIYAHIWDDEMGTEWPGIKGSAGYFDSETYLVFLTPAAFKGKTLNVMFHSDENDEQNRFQTTITLDQDRFYNLNKEFSFNEQEKKPVVIYVDDRTGWDAIALYMWGEVDNLGGGWPGVPVTRTEEISGTTFKVFEVANALGLKEVLIFNNNGAGTQLNNYPDDNGMLFDKEEYFFVVTAEGVTPTERPSGVASTIYVANKMGWDPLHLYAWGDAEIFGGWAGTQGTKVGTWSGVPVFTFEVAPENSGKTENLIFNNGNGGDGNQFDALKDWVAGSDTYLEIDNFSCTTTTPTVRIYVVDNTGWDDLCVYSWGTGETFGGWPGTKITETQTINGVEYKYVDVPADKYGWTANVIFNNNAGTQVENFDCLKDNTLDFDLYFTITGDSAAPAL